MRNRCILLAALFAATCVSLASAQVAAVSAPAMSVDEPRIGNLQIRNMRVLQALDILLGGTGRNYRLMPGTRVDGVVTVTLRDVPLDNAVTIVLRSAGLQAAREDHTYVIQPILVAMTKPPTAPQQMPSLFPGPPIGTVDVKPSGGQRFDILLDKANVLEAMRQILEVAGQSYVIDTGLGCAWAGPLGPRISARMRSLTLDEALQALGKSASLVVAKVGITYTVRPPDGAIPFSYIPGPSTNKGAKNGPGATDTVPVPLCAGCNRPLDPAWQYCPQCGLQVPAPTPSPK